MCILFVYINNNAVGVDEYQVIIAMNRDEFIDRPTLPVHFWNEHCVSGIDVLPGREGGTWFGVSSKFAKIGALLNNFERDIDPTKQPRGPLVPNYLQTGQDAAAYIETVARQQDFNAFNLVLLEQRDGIWSIHYFCNKDDKSPRQLADGVQVIGNSVISCPWQKVIKGRETFEQIVSKHHHKCASTELKKDLISMLSDSTSHMPDPVLEAVVVQTSPDAPENVLCRHEFLPRRSAVFVDLYNSVRYGTRTQTLLLIDKAGSCEYIEETLSSDAINAYPERNASVTGKRPSDWQSTQFSFSLGL